MEQWQDQAILLSARRHGENGAIISLLTRDHGRHVAYVRGANGRTMRGVLEVGNIVDAKWQTRTSEAMGTYALDLMENPSVSFLSDGVRLAALQSACALCDAAVPEGESHTGLYHGTLALFDAMRAQEIWSQAYVMWELAFLRELGFSLDLHRCAGGGDADDLRYVSPKTGRAVSAQAGEPYAHKLLPLPEFLSPKGGMPDQADILQALELTGYFLQNWAFAQHSRGIPEARLRFHERFAKTIACVTKG